MSRFATKKQKNHLATHNKAAQLLLYSRTSDSSSVGRAAASQAAGRGFEPRLSLT